jgi:hypothetical protein
MQLYAVYFKNVLFQFSNVYRHFKCSQIDLLKPISLPVCKYLFLFTKKKYTCKINIQVCTNVYGSPRKTLSEKRCLEAGIPRGDFILAPTTVGAGPCIFDIRIAGAPGFEFQENSSVSGLLFLTRP